MKNRLLVFDFDGTIINTSEALTMAVNELLSRYGLPPVGVREVKKAVGGGIQLTLKKLFGEKYHDGLVSEFRSIYPRYLESHVRVYDGMDEAIRTLYERDYKMAILSNGSTPFMEKMLERFDLRDYFHLIVGIDKGFPPKPDRTALLYIMELMGSDPDHTIFIGDSEYDIMTAKNAGVRIIFVSWGYGENIGADVEVDSAEELPEVVEMLFRESERAL